jgi:hypothetical protein
MKRSALIPAGGGWRAAPVVAIALIGLAACNQHTSTPSNAATATKIPAAESASFQASDAVTKRFGAGVFTHDVVEDQTATGTAACGYYSPKNNTKAGAVFVFADGRLVTADDLKPDAFRALVEHDCPDFVMPVGS